MLTSQAVAEPSAEIKRLIDTFEGRWSVRETHYPSAWRQHAATGVGTAEFSRGPGSMSLLQTYRSSIGEFSFEGRGVTWWNSQAQHYEGIWCENSAPDGCDDSGSVFWKDNRLIAEYEDEMDGKPTKERRTISNIAPNSFTVVIEMAIGDAPLRPAIKIDYEREDVGIAVSARGRCANTRQTTERFRDRSGREVLQIVDTDRAGGNTRFESIRRSRDTVITTSSSSSGVVISFS